MNTAGTMMVKDLFRDRINLTQVVVTHRYKTQGRPETS